MLCKRRRFLEMGGTTEGAEGRMATRVGLESSASFRATRCSWERGSPFFSLLFEAGAEGDGAVGVEAWRGAGQGSALGATLHHLVRGGWLGASVVVEGGAHGSLSSFCGSSVRFAFASSWVFVPITTFSSTCFSTASPRRSGLSSNGLYAIILKLWFGLSFASIYMCALMMTSSVRSTWYSTPGYTTLVSPSFRLAEGLNTFRGVWSAELGRFLGGAVLAFLFYKYRLITSS